MDEKDRLLKKCLARLDVSHCNGKMVGPDVDLYNEILMVLVDFGPQKSPSSVAKIEAERKAIKRFIGDMAEKCYTMEESVESLREFLDKEEEE
jgi:hypothetical protein